MSTYKYSLYDYHAVQSAEIELSGITVISGINGSGKSTLSKWLYYLINESAQFNRHIVSQFLSFVYDKVLRIDMLRRDIRVFSGLSEMMDPRMVFDVRKRILSIDDSTIEAMDNASDVYFSFLESFSPHLQYYLDNVKTGSRRERVLQTLDVEATDADDVSSIVQRFIEENHKEVEERQKAYLEIIEERYPDNFFYNIQSNYNEEDEAPSRIQLKEDGVQLLQSGKNRVSELYNLSRAIYVDTPMSVSGSSSDNHFWTDLMRLMMSEKTMISVEAKKILLRIQNIIKGHAEIEKDAFGDSELHFVSNDGLNIKLERVATGFKTFAYLQKLVENGHINDKTLLLIDEPEAHLHPQWIVEFARLLVLLHKNLGLKMMIASHNPDMVSAISAISQKEGIDGNTRFYLSEQNSETRKFVFKNLGTDISEIFTSFNIALDRINLYGNTEVSLVLE